MKITKNISSSIGNRYSKILNLRYENKLNLKYLIILYNSFDGLTNDKLKNYEN